MDSPLYSNLVSRCCDTQSGHADVNMQVVMRGYAS